jgi:hypothetical protein
MRHVFSNLMMRLVCCTVPFFVVKDFIRAIGIGKGDYSWMAIWIVLIPIMGFVGDVARVRRAAAGDEHARQSIDRAPRFRFRLRTLLLLMLITAFYLTFRFSDVVRQKGIVAELRAAGVPVEYERSLCTWMDGLFGLELFGSVRKVTLVSDAQTLKLPDLSALTEVDLWGPGITDASIETLTALPKLKKILVETTSITPAGLSRLRDSLPDCDVATFP